MTVPHPNLAALRGVPTVFLDENFAALDGALGSSSNNLMLNGDLRFWRQNGPSVGIPNVGTILHGPDMVAGQCIGSSLSLTRGQTSLGDYPGQPKYYMSVSATSVAGAANFARLLLYFEDVRIFAGQTLTLAFKSNCVADGVAALSARQYFGTGGSPSAEVNSYIGTIAFSSGAGLQEQSVTFTVPSISGKTIGSNEDSLFAICIWFDAGSNNDSITNSLGQHSFAVNMWDFRLNFGSLSIARNVPTDIGARYTSLCRYYWKTFFNDQAPASNLGAGTGNVFFPQPSVALGAQQVPAIEFPVPMWKTPTCTIYSVDAVGNTIRTIGIGNWTALTATPTVKNFSVVGTTPAGSAAGYTCGYHLTADAFPAG